MSTQAIAIVGLACKYPDAPDLQSFWHLVITGRRAFRRIPPSRLDLDDYYSCDRSAPDAVLRTRVALIEGWEPDPLPGSAQLAAGPAYGLALETAAGALRDAGFPNGQGLSRDRAGVIIGTSSTNSTRQAAMLRLRWPHVRKVLASALETAAVDPVNGWQDHVLETAATFFRARFPEVTGDTRLDGVADTIAGSLCAHFGFRGGGHAVASADASSLLAVAAACTALTTGDLDFALVGGVDVGLDPIDLVASANAGALASDEMRIYDAVPTGFFFGEGCGLAALMRADEARARGLSAYALVTGWGTSSAGSARSGCSTGRNVIASAPNGAHVLDRPIGTDGAFGVKGAFGSAGAHGVNGASGADSTGTARAADADTVSGADRRVDADTVFGTSAADRTSAGDRTGSAEGSDGTDGPFDADSLLLALRRAYERAGADPADAQFFEGHAAGTARSDLEELTALRALRADAQPAAALGSIKANIGNTRAAAGIAGLLKTVLAVSAGTLPPSTGCEQVHPLLRDATSSLRILAGAEPWPAGRRMAGVTAMGTDGTNAHIVLCRPDKPNAQWRTLSAKPDVHVPGQATVRPPRSEVYAFSGDDAADLAATLRRIAEVSPWFTDGEQRDLALQQAGRNHRGRLRVAFAAAGAAELARRAGQAARLVTRLTPGPLHHEHGVFAGNSVRGRIVLLFPGQSQADAPGGHAPADAPSAGGPASNPLTMRRTTQDAVTAAVSLYQASGAALQWLDRLGVTPAAAVGHGAGEITALAWAGCFSEADAARVVSERARVVSEHAARGTATLSVSTDAATARVLSEGTDVVIAAYNGPHLHLLAGSTDAVHKVAERAALRGIAATVLPPPHGFHLAGVGGGWPGHGFGPSASGSSPECTASPQANGTLRASAAALRGVLRSITFGPPRRRIISTITGCELGPRDDIPGLLYEQLTAPVRFHEAVRTAARFADLFCEAGPGRVLTGFAAQCCPLPVIGAAGGLSVAVGGDNRENRRKDVARASAAAALFAVRAASSLEPIFADRTGRPLDIWRERVFISGAWPTDAAPGVVAPTGLPGSPGPDSQSADAPAQPTRPTSQPADPPVQSDEPTSRSADPQAHDRAGHNGPTSPPEGPPRPPERPQPATETTAAQAACHDEDVPGIGPWIRCFAEATRPLPELATTAPSGPWRVRVIGRQPFGKIIDETFASDVRADCVLACVADAGDPDAAGCLLEAAREALGCDRLVVITHGGALTGFCRSMRAEHPRLGITLLRVPESPEGLRRARRFAAADPGVYREIILADGRAAATPASEPVTITGTGATPLAAADVVLLSGGAKGVGLAWAEAIASTGAAVAIVGRGDPSSDPAIRAGLDRLRRAGACTAYEPADIADPAAMRTAVRRLEERLGPVTALVQWAGPVAGRRFTELTADDIRTQLRPAAGMASALAAVRSGRLRLVVTFGSITGRYGRAGECHHALAGGALREQAERLARREPDCRVLHLDWAAWSGADVTPIPATVTPSRATATPIPAAEAGRLLLRLIATAGLPGALAIHGRAGLPPAPLDAPGRFLESVRVHYPGVELVADAHLGPDADPYLADYRLDGKTMLPAALAIEAMAQAATALAGQPVREARDVRLASPVPISSAGSARIRICALHHGDHVEAVLRSAETGHRTDYVRAIFPVAASKDRDTAEPDVADGGAGDGPASDGTALSVLSASVPSQPSAPSSPSAAAASSIPSPPSISSLPLLSSASAVSSARSGSVLLEDMSGGIVDGTELYGPLCFQTGPFRRVAFLPGLSSRSCRALIRGADDAPWFGPDLAEAPVLLGSPGVNDAAFHVLQACVPHRRLMLAGCERMTTSGRTVSGAVEMRARQRLATAGEYIWDVTAVDGDGRHLATWTGLRLADVGPLRRTEPWPPTLLAVYLERRAATLGLDAGLRVAVRAGHPRQISCGCTTNGSRATGHGTAGYDVASVAENGRAGGPFTEGRTGSAVAPSGLFFMGAGLTGRACRSHLDGLTLTVETSGPAACDWEAVEARQGPALPFAPDGKNLYERLTDSCRERSAIVRSRIWTAVECMRKSGQPVGSSLAFGEIHDDGWVSLHAGDTAIASAVVRVSGVTGPVAVAIMTSAQRSDAASTARVTPQTQDSQP